MLAICLWSALNELCILITTTNWSWLDMLASPECDKLRKDGFRSSQCYSQSPAFSATSLCDSVHLDEEKTEKKKKVNLTLTQIWKTVLTFAFTCMLLLEKNNYFCNMLYAVCNAVYNQFHQIITKILLAFNYIGQADIQASFSNLSWHE